MLSRVQPLQKSQIYIKKKAKEPDHLFNLLQKHKYRQHNSLDHDNQDLKDKLKKQIMQKRIDLILKNDNRKPKVSEPIPFVKKQWASPLAQLTQTKQIEAFGQIKNSEVKLVKRNKQEVKKVLKILDINKTLRYFGQYLQVSHDTEKPVQVAKLTEKQSKVSYVSQKFNQIFKKQRPKLCIMNCTTQKQVTFINYLQDDKFYQNVIRKTDNQLIRILIQALQMNGNFTMASYLRFYEIFVWQSADKNEQIDFVLKILMGECNQRSIVEISKKVDIICRKIFIQNFNKSLQNFNQIMKKLLFGDDYQYSTQKEYHMTRKAFTESLQRNQECISIFVNIFYAS